MEVPNNCSVFGFGNVTESEEELAPARAEGTNARGSPRREREKPQGHMKDKWCRWLQPGREEKPRRKTLASKASHNQHVPPNPPGDGRPGVCPSQATKA